MTHGHSHGHSHHTMVYDHVHAERYLREYRSYGYLFAISLIGAVAEFLTALLLARSVSAQTDAIHALTHVSLFALAWWVSRRIVTKKMNLHEARHYHEKFLGLYTLLVLSGLVWVLYASILKLLSPESVVGIYMFMSVSMGLCANIFALVILRGMLSLHGETASPHKTLRLLKLDVRGDLAFSAIVLATSIASLLFPLLPIQILDPVISLGGIAWFGWSGVQILKDHTIAPLSPS